MLQYQVAHNQHVHTQDIQHKHSQLNDGDITVEPTAFALDTESMAHKHTVCVSEPAETYAFVHAVYM